MKQEMSALVGVMLPTVLALICMSVWLTSLVPSIAIIGAGETSHDEQKEDTRLDVPSPSNGVVDAAEDEHVRKVIGIGLPNIEEDVIRMNIRKVVGTLGKETFMSNRLLAKLQGMHTQQADRCVIRVAIQCGWRCSIVQTKLGSTEDIFSWHIHPCSSSLPLPCNIERKFVINVTSHILNMSDVVIFGLTGHAQGRYIDKMVAKRPPGQLWTFTSNESPRYRKTFVPKTPGAENPYNLSMTHIQDSDIYSPYWHFQKEPVSTAPPLRNKTKLIAWMASHCTNTGWKRLEFVKYLKIHLDIDTYGECGELGVIPKGKEDVLKQYKFYLALENSEYRDYITEKVPTNGFKNGAVPIVYGSRSEDYARMLPANSYIDLQTFDSIGDFVDFIQALDNDIHKYNKYFGWWKRGIIINHSIWSFNTQNPGVNMCYLIRKFVHLSLHPETAWQKRTPDFGTWLQGSSEPLQTLLGFDIRTP